MTEISLKERLNQCLNDHDLILENPEEFLKALKSFNSKHHLNIHQDILIYNFINEYCKIDIIPVGSIKGSGVFIKRIKLLDKPNE